MHHNTVDKQRMWRAIDNTALTSLFLSLKGNVYQQAVVHLSIPGWAPDKDNNWERRGCCLYILRQDGTGLTLQPQVSTAVMTEEDGVWACRKLEDNSCSLAESIPSHIRRKADTTQCLGSPWLPVCAVYLEQGRCSGGKTVADIAAL